MEWVGCLTLLPAFLCPQPLYLHEPETILLFQHIAVRSCCGMYICRVNHSVLLPVPCVLLGTTAGHAGAVRRRGWSYRISL
jgi:hypothetical protein